MRRPSGYKRQVIAGVFAVAFLLLRSESHAQDVRAAVERLATQIGKAAPEGRQQLRIAVADFPDLQGLTSDLGRFVAERLTTRLARGSRFFVIERRRLSQVLAELRFSISDLVDPAKVKQLGRMLGVEAIVVGLITDLGSQVDIDARVIEIETNRIILGATATVSKDQTVLQMLETGRQEQPVSSSPTRIPGATHPAVANIPGPSAEQQILNKFVKANGDINIRDGLPEGLFYRKSRSTPESVTAAVFMRRAVQGDGWRSPSEL